MRRSGKTAPGINREFILRNALSSWRPWIPVRMDRPGRHRPMAQAKVILAGLRSGRRWCLTAGYPSTMG